MGRVSEMDAARARFDPFSQPRDALISDLSEDQDALGALLTFCNVWRGNRWNRDAAMIVAALRLVAFELADARVRLATLENSGEERSDDE